MGQRTNNSLNSTLYSDGTALISGQFVDYCKAKGHPALLVPFMATVAGIKPAMDDWVDVKRLENYLQVCKNFGLYTQVSCYFQRLNDLDVSQIKGGHQLTTTRARAIEKHSKPQNGEAHVFLSRDKSNLEQAFVNGWYTVAIENEVIDKPFVDHPDFGKSLGYPDCCIQYFIQNNDWENKNFYYSIFRRSSILNPLCNSFTRHTLFSYLSHMPCQFNCKNSIAYASKVRDMLLQEEPKLMGVIDEFIHRPILCLSERHLYISDGFVSQNRNKLCYDEIALLPPTSLNESLLRLLAVGNSLSILGNVIRVFRDDKLQGIYEAKGNQIGPEAPILINWS